MGNELSPTMQDAIDHARKHDAILVRFPGGFWSNREWRQHEGPWFGTSTIEGIVKRGAGEYVKWQKRKDCPENLSTHSCQFPIEMRVTL